MRTSAVSANKDFRAKAIAGTHTVLMALNCRDSRRQGFRGFAFRRSTNGGPARFLRSLKVFKSIVPDPKALIDGKAQKFTTDQHPVQSFLWGDYTAQADTEYTFTVSPMYGKPGALVCDPNDEVTFTVRTEKENDPDGHGVWFNRGAIASQAFAREFGNVKPSTQQLEDLSQPVTKWLSRGLVEACLAFINETQPGDRLRACVYEFTYKPVLNAFKAAIDRGVDVQISYHQTTANDNAIEATELPRKAKGRQVLFPRTVPKIPHNKFIVRVVDEKPSAVWTGSTNFTPSGFLGQSNVGHIVNEGTVAEKYLQYFKAFVKDPDASTAKAAVTKLTPHPAELIGEDSINVVFSPRHRATMLAWYANRMVDACESIMFTAAFGVNAKFVLPLAHDRDFLRYVLMERRPAKEMEKALRADRDLIISFGAVLGEVAKFQNGTRTTERIKNFGLDEWFREEEHFRKAGNIFFVHTKFMLIDPLSKDPLVCSGSANFSDNSLTANDENMLLIRGNTRVADIYLTEFDRIFRHFYFRNVANEIELKGGKATGAFLDETDQGPKHWTTSYFKAGAFKTRRRELFFNPSSATWAGNAGEREEFESRGNGDTPTGRAGGATKKRAKTTKQ
jgi:phosphatidylserine/phosphatidylglycerophosphate/cardiolipin synthase-like enzyme